ncbi:type II toxin-antitoxin system HipA family toxin [Algoriphagus sp.]|uniref:type II toxin-antitoxin system HipA family toxin n=1 Tax=Algoriphagus sp. TaxID=1872435 RepID=UPI003919108E
MNLHLKNCPITLSSSFKSYSPIGLKQLFSGKKTSHLLPYESHQPENEAEMEEMLENRKRISISGAQEKLSAIWEKGSVRLTKNGEQGTFILKPFPRDMERVDMVPANEHLTMQIAKQVFGLRVAENGLIFYQNGEPAYITKRFDIDYSTGKKLGKEDFATLAGKTKETDGEEFKYNYSYEGIADLIKKYVGAYPFALEEFFKLMVFNFLFSNGDAHLKNFSLLETSQGDHMLSPAYDLVNTRLHVKDPELALKDGLFKDDFLTPSFEANGFLAYDDFWEFGIRIGILKSRVLKVMDQYRSPLDEVAKLTERSFLDNDSKNLYLNSYQTRLKSLNYSFTKLI